MPDLLTLWARSLPLPPRHSRKVPGGVESYVPGLESMYDIDMPWVVYHYGRTHDGWWPSWRSSRILGRATVECECAICGVSRVIVAKMPRFGPVNPERREHPERTRFKLDHLHRDRGHPMSWARPFLNPDAHPGGIDLDMLAMRLESDLRNADA